MKKRYMPNFQLMFSKHSLFALAAVFCFPSIYAQENIALNKKTTMSSISSSYDSPYAVDGKIELTKEDVLEKGFFTKTKTINYQWVQIDLEASYDISKVFFYTYGLEHIFRYLTNGNLVLAVSDDPKFKGVYNPRECNQYGVATINLEVNDIGITRPAITQVNKKMTGRYVRIWDLDNGGITLSEIQIEGTLNEKAVEEAVASGDAQLAERLLKERMNSGEHVDHDKTLRLAIEQKNVQMIEKLLSVNNRVSQETFDYAVNSQYNSVVVKSLLNSGNPSFSAKSISTLIQKKETKLVERMLSSSPSTFNSSHVDQAMKFGQNSLGEKILKKAKITPSATTLSAAVNSGNMLFVSDLINKYGAAPTPAMLTAAIKTDNEAMINLFLTKVKPNGDAYVLAAQKKDSDLYENLTSIRNLSDNRSINVAIDNGSMSILKNGLSSGGDVNEALKYAISKDKSEIIDYLVTRKGVNVKPAVTYAITKNRKELLTRLLQNEKSDADLALSEAMTKSKYDLAIIALESGRTKPSKFLKTAIKKDQDVLAKKIVEYGGDPDLGMELAIEKNKFALVDFFIQQNASVSNPKFMDVAAQSNLDITKVLVESGADANNGILSACKGNKLDIAEYLIENGADANKGMQVASLAGHTRIVSLLIENGADAQPGIKGAVKGNHLETTKLLLENGADCTEPELIQIASQEHNVQLVKELIEYGANPQEGVWGAIFSNDDETFKLLLEYEVEVNDEGYMLEAVKKSAFRVIPLLAAQGINMDYTTSDGFSFLHISLKYANSLNTVAALLEAGVSPSAKTNKGDTAIHTAARKGKEYISIIQALVRAGANINAVNNVGETPRKVAYQGATKTAIKKLGGEKKIK